MMFGANYVQSSTAPFNGAIWNNVATFTPVTGVTHQTFYSVTMQRTIGFSLFLPVGYPAGAPYNVIYVLPGGGSNENGFAAIIAHYAAAQPVIVVYVNGDYGKYMDAVVGAAAYPSFRLETALITELIPFIIANYKTKGTKKGRAITGVSGGGLGALRLCFKYPQMFSSVYAYAAAIDDNAGNVAANENAIYVNMFNSDASAFGAQTCQALAASNAANIIAQAPAIHLCCGTTDGLYSANQGLDTVLTNNSIVHDALESINGVGHVIEDIWASQGGHTDLDFMWNHFS